MKKDRAVSGVSLLEIMMIIAISAIVLILAVNYYSNVRLSSKINRTVMQVRDLYQGGVTYFNAAKYQDKTFTNSDITSDLLKGNYISPNDQQSAWGTAQSNVVKLTSGSTNTLIIILPPLPPKACTVVQNRLTASFAQVAFSTCSTSATNGVAITFSL